MTTIKLPKHGEIWLINFDPTQGDEIKKTRPAVVLSSDTIKKLSIKLVAPVTGWKPHFSSNFWHIKVQPDATNGLAKTSAIDALQLRGVDLQRFIRKLGDLSPTKMKKISLAIITVIEADVDLA